MQKLGLGILGIILVAAIYYFTFGADQVREKLQQELSAQLTDLETKGFGISEREIKKREEHFVISLDDPKKASAFLTQQGLEFSVQDAEELKGIKLGVDVEYLSHAVALELYPVALPTKLSTSITDENDKKILAQIEKMLEKKTFLLHVNADYSTTSFKGYLKDINETLQGEQEVKFRLQGLHFSGKIKGDRVSQVDQTLNVMRLYVSDEINMYLSGLQSSYRLTGDSVYDYITEYSIAQIKIDANDELDLTADEITMHSTSTVKDGLVSETLKSKIKNIEMIVEGDRLALETSILDMKVDNLDVSAFEKLQTVDPENEQEFNAALQKLISNNVHLEISTLSADKVTLQGKKVDGFTLHSTLDIDKSLNISRLEANPMYALDKIDAKLKVSLSKALLDLISRDPKAMIALMIFTPKDVNGKQVYSVELKDGSLKVNGKSVL
ncbi:MAG: hypothetical protein COB07_09275 [Sulfurovum sp.]|nr:MAG: hypothetical protein COB07_09275 [Sulfurovum sp.]